MSPLRTNGHLSRNSITGASNELQYLRIRSSDEDQYSSDLAEQLLISLHPSSPVSFEVLGVDGEAMIQMVAAQQDASVILGQIEAYYPGCEAFESQDILQEAAEQLRFVRGYRSRRSHLLSLREGHRTDPFTALIGLLSTLGLKEAALYQVLFIPARHNWQGNIIKVSSDPFDPKKSMFPDMPRLPKKAEAKVSKPLFAVSVRMAASSDELLKMLEGSFLSQFQSEENSLVSMPGPYPIERVLNRNSYSTGKLLNAGELEAMVHLPNPDLMPEAFKCAEPGASPPRIATEDILVPLGSNRHGGKDTTVGISSDQLTRHMAIFGGSGNGKTNLMLLAFEPHIDQGGGGAAIDFKRDFAHGLLDRIPEHRLEDIVWFDPTDREYPPALNVLEASSELSDEALTAELMVGLKRLFRGNSEFGPRMEWILRNAVRTLLLSEEEKTLYDIPRFLEDASFRESVLASIQDRELREFWGRRSLSSSVIDPVLNRLSSFLDRPSIRNVVSQPNRIDFHQIIRERKIFIANLEKGVLQDAAFVLGSFILSRLQLAALARPPDERTLFPIIVDEFHNVAG